MKPYFTGLSGVRPYRDADNGPFKEAMETRTTVGMVIYPLSVT